MRTSRSSGSRSSLAIPRSPHQVPARRAPAAWTFIVNETRLADARADGCLLHRRGPAFHYTDPRPASSANGPRRLELILWLRPTSRRYLPCNSAATGVLCKIGPHDATQAVIRDRCAPAAAQPRPGPLIATGGAPVLVRHGQAGRSIERIRHTSAVRRATRCRPPSTQAWQPALPPHVPSLARRARDDRYRAATRPARRPDPLCNARLASETWPHHHPCRTPLTK